MQLCNPLSCSGLGFSLLGPCSMVWIAAVIVFFVIILTRKWIFESLNMPFSTIGSFVLGYLAFIVAVVFSCSHKIALVAGIAGAFIGGYFGSMLLEDSGGGGY